MVGIQSKVIIGKDHANDSKFEQKFNKSSGNYYERTCLESGKYRW